jgi:hypothetical protein
VTAIAVKREQDARHIQMHPHDSPHYSSELIGNSSNSVCTPPNV